MNTDAAPGLLDGTDALAPGMLAGPWRIERELGRGGMGTVYAVVHAEIGKHAALKVVHRRLASAPSEDRMLLEAQVVNRVGHPNIVDIFETGQLPDGRHYLVMERLEGQPLAHRADEGKLPPGDVIEILLQICDALIAAHAAGIVHRDLKLDNVFLVDNPDDPRMPRVKLLDWGIAKAIDQAGPRHTIDGQLVGTPQYLAPEQARGGQVTTKSDVYSLGVMAYELFVDQLPFEAETAAEIMTMHLRATPPPASDVWPEIPRELEDLLHAMLAKSATHRPSMLEVAHRLEAIRPRFAATTAPPPRRRTTASPVRHPTVPPTRRRAASPRKSRWQWGLGAAAIAIAAVMFAVGRRADSAAAAVFEPAAAFAPLAPRPLTSKPIDIPDPPPRAPAGDPPRAPVQAPRDATPPRVHSEPRATAPLAPPATPRLPTMTTGSKSRAAVTRAAHQAPVAPRREASQDPDGTVDPYR